MAMGRGEKLFNKSFILSEGPSRHVPSEGIHTFICKLLSMGVMQIKCVNWAPLKKKVRGSMLGEQTNYS